jgi:hypothetical protein
MHPHHLPNNQSFKGNNVKYCKIKNESPIRQHPSAHISVDAKRNVSETSVGIDCEADMDEDDVWLVEDINLASPKQYMSQSLAPT